MDVASLKNIADLGAFGVILVILVAGLYLIYVSTKEYINSKSKEDKDEKDYYRKKIDEKDIKIEEITERFTKVVEDDIKELKYEVRRMSDKLECK